MQAAVNNVSHRPYGIRGCAHCGWLSPHSKIKIFELPVQGFIRELDCVCFEMWHLCEPYHWEIYPFPAEFAASERTFWFSMLLFVCVQCPPFLPLLHHEEFFTVLHNFLQFLTISSTTSPGMPPGLLLVTSLLILLGNTTYPVLLRFVVYCLHRLYPKYTPYKFLLQYPRRCCIQCPFRPCSSCPLSGIKNLFAITKLQS